MQISDHFYGTGETFLFTFHPDFACYPWTGENLFFIKGNIDSISIGAGEYVDNQLVFCFQKLNNIFIKLKFFIVTLFSILSRGSFGLWLDGDLYHGSSHPCKTFGNRTLSSEEDFVVKSIECWGFV